mgnify:FL=1
MMTLGSNIKHHRTHLGLTLAQLSELSGVEVGTISALENRNSKRSEHASAIARALGLTVEELESGSKAAKITTSSDIGKHRAAEERAPWLRDENERLLIDGYRVASPGLRQAMTALAREAVNTFSKRIGNGN